MTLATKIDTICSKIDFLDSRTVIEEKPIRGEIRPTKQVNKTGVIFILMYTKIQIIIE
jgi:hypothetical protein